MTEYLYPTISPHPCTECHTIRPPGTLMVSTGYHCEDGYKHSYRCVKCDGGKDLRAYGERVDNFVLADMWGG